MPYRLALDLGTASIGLVAINLDTNKQPINIPYHAVHIFPEPLVPSKQGGVGEPKKATRRMARASRRLIDRRAHQLRQIGKLSHLLGLQPSDIPADKGQHIHQLRAQASNQSIPLPDLVNIFLKMAKRRGYSGGFRVKKEGDEGTVEKGINELKTKMQEAGCHWLGEYLYHRFKNKETLKLKEAGLYADRELVEAEFEQIWKTQSKYHEMLNNNIDGKPLHDIFHRAIFYQRPLKSVTGMVGNCPLETNLPRAPMAQPIAQAFRIEKQLSDLRWGMGRTAQPLTIAQRNLIRQLLHDKEKATFKQIYKALEKGGCPKPLNQELNFDRPSRPELKGNTTLHTMRKLKLGDRWSNLDESTQISIINFLANIGSPQEVDRLDWHLQYQKRDGNPRHFKKEMVHFINEMVNSGKFDRLSKMGFDSGRSAYSIKALKKLTAHMQEGADEYTATITHYPHTIPNKESTQAKLKPHKSTGNVVVDVALGQLRHQINKAIDIMGYPPSEVIVELTREMGLGIKRRSDIENRIKKNQYERKKVIKELENHGTSATPTNIFRYRLWQQQDTNCPFCDTKICLSDATNGNMTNLEHIIPRSLTRVGRQQDHLVLAHRKCNDEKGDKTPWQRWGIDTDRWKIITERAKALEKKKYFTKARLLTLQDHQREIITNDIIQDFSNRQYHESSWISKLAAQWLRTICPDVAVSRGALTAYLRRIWGLETVIPEIRYESGLPVLDSDNKIIEKLDFDRYRRYWEGHQNSHNGNIRTDRKIEKRIDHRHHLIDALVIGMTSRSLFQKMACNYKLRSEQMDNGENVRITLAVDPPMQDLRRKALEITRNSNLTHRPDHYYGSAFFQDTAYGVAWVEPDNDPNADAILRLTSRSKLVDLVDKNTDPSKARRILNNIASEITRNAVLKVFEKQISKGMTAQEALAVPIYHPDTKTAIKRVKLLKDKADGAFKVEHNNRQNNPQKPLYKFLLHNGYAYLEIAYTNGKPITELVTPLTAQLRKNTSQESRACRIYKGDTVLDSKDNKKFLIKQIIAAGGGALIMIPATDSREVRDMKSKDGLRKVTGKSLMRIKLLSND